MLNIYTTLSQSYIYIYIYKGEKFYSSGFLEFPIFQKEIHRYVCIPQKSGHVTHAIKNYVLAELKTYISLQHLNTKPTKN